MKKPVARVCLCALVGISALIGIPDLAQAAACASADSGPGLQYLLNHTPPGGTLCIDSGTYTISASLVLPDPMTVIGTGPTAPVIECAAAVSCINGSAGPNDVVLQNLVLQNASKTDVQIGSGASDTPVTGWRLQGITATGGGQAGITINTASDITVSGSTVERNGSTPYDAVANPTGDFGLRANRVDALTVEDSTFSNNPVVSGTDINPGFAGGAKFDTDTNLLVQHNTFTGNAGGAQLWFDISSSDFHAVDNTIDAAPNAVTGIYPTEGIRAEVSCAGTDGSTIESNEVEGGTLAAIDLFDSNGIVVTHNHLLVPASTQASYGIRMEGNVHGQVPADGCDDAGFYANRDNVASYNDISMSDTGNALNGVENDPGGVSRDNIWVDNLYTVRHCYNLQWTWWDGSAQHEVDFAAWQAFGQDAAAASTCTAVVPEIDGTPPFAPTWGPVGTTVTINGSGLQGVTSVRFNAKSAPILSTSGSQVVATVPAGATTGPICIKALTQTRCTTMDFTLAPVVNITGMLPSSGLPGTHVVIGGQPFTGVTGVTFGGHPAPFTFVSDTEIDATVPPDATPGPVCVLMPIQGATCGPDTFTVIAPAAPLMTSPVGPFRLDPFSAVWLPSAGAESYGVLVRSAPYNAGFGAWSAMRTTTGTSWPLSFVPGRTTCVLVLARNGGGSTPGLQTCTAVPLDDRRLTRASGTWTRVSSRRLYLGGAISSRIHNATLTFSGIQARAIGLMVQARPGGGSVDVFLNGRLLRRVSTAAPRVLPRRMVPLASWTSLQTGTITIRVHTAGRRVVIDGLAVSRV
jgi:hypothetical protein